ncbi:unnamed protein product [Chironomus riparius]|uniref:60S ribosomal export protein NMD3 n=1 Tax=Chironomus riparius TaxID=315576 RepID=A0A9N9WXA0_9DIPT|nr:unnamed protein product [Chironomus riparius]
MEYVSAGSSSGPQAATMQILCCSCGTLIDPNPLNTCAACLRTQVDITENIPKQGTLLFCRNCERYLNPPNDWITASLESRELLSLCLKRIKGLKEVKLVDAGFIWTEPHSKRVKVKLTVHAEVHGGIVLEQVFVVEFVVNNQMCDDCHRHEAKDFWKCMVQVRQKASNKKTLYYMEQMILKHKAHDNTLGIKNAPCGLDFFFTGENHARKMVDFLHTILPLKFTQSKKLISHDIHSNEYNYKFTWVIEIVPISKGSLVCLSKKLQQSSGNISPICLVQNVATTVHLIDPITAQMADISGQTYFRYPFLPICDPKQLVQYTVMDIEIIKERKTFPGQGPVSYKHVIADIWLVKSSELGINDSTIHTKTHLGHLLRPGDEVLGFDLRDSVINNDDFEKLNPDNVPDVIVIKKHFPDKDKRRRMRKWKLKRLPKEADGDTDMENDYNEFLDDLEEDPDMRMRVNIYKDNKKQQIPVDENDMDDPSAPQITLEEMLDDLVINDVEMADA